MEAVRLKPYHAADIRTDDWEVITIRSVTWSEIESLQRNLCLEIQANPSRRYFLAFEPTPVFTAGRSADMLDLLWNAEECKNRGIEVIDVDRGGKWTYHGPGQLVLFPLVYLPSVGMTERNSKLLVATIEQALIGFVRRLGVSANTLPGRPGLFVGQKKLGSIGLRIKDGITTHGLSIYIEPQQENFTGIRACGVTAQELISLSELGVAQDWNCIALDLAMQIENSFKTIKN